MSIGDPPVYTDEQIEAILAGDNRDIDRIMMRMVNALTVSFITFRDSEFRTHVREETAIFDALGTADEIEQRRIWLDLQIKREQTRAKFREKIIISSALWALPFILAFLVITFSDGLRNQIAQWLSTPPQTALKGK